MDISQTYTTFSVKQDGSSKALHLDINRDDDQVVVASSAVFRIYHIEETEFKERVNLRGSKAQNLNYSCNDVCWNKHDPHILATAATNGAVVIWNLGRTSRAKQEHVFNEHQRTVNKVTFHPVEANYLLSGSQDGTIKLFDIRTHEAATAFVTNSFSVRDVAFNPHGNGHLFAAGMENGSLQLWDVRRPDRYEKKWSAHTDHIFAVDWHPESRYTLASAGREKQIKVWNTVETKCEHLVHSIGPVGRIKWRPRYNYHIASCSGMVGDFSVSVWDVRRPYVPYAVFREHKTVATDIKFLSDSERLISGSKDNLIHHAFSDSHKVMANPTGLAVNNHGKVACAFRDESVSVTSPTSSTLAAFPEIVPKLAPVLTPTESSTSFRVASFLRSRKDTTSSANSDSSPLKAISPVGIFNDDFEDRPPPPPPAEKDLFLTFTSQINEFCGKDGNEIWTSNDHFVTCAQKYMLSGASLEVLCEHNAQVSESANRNQIAETWRLIKALVRDPFDIMDEDDDESDFVLVRKGSNENSDKTDFDTRDDDSKGMRGIQSRATTDSLMDSRNKRRGSSANSERKYNRGKNSSADSGKMDTNNQSDDDLDDHDYAENELTLTNIASGQMLTGGVCNDFFGDTEIGVADLEIETFVSSEINHDHSSWELRSEAFEPRVNLNIEMTNDQVEENRIGEDLNGVVHDNNSNADEDPQNMGTSNSSLGNTGQTFVIEDQTSSLLCIEQERSFWGPTSILKSTLQHLAEAGDVQNAVSMLIVLRSISEYRFLIDDTSMEFWFNCYIDLLQKFKLYNVANNLIKKCPIPAINHLTQQSTTFFTNCFKCNRALSRPQGTWWCDKCKRTPNLCAVCKGLVKGLYAWCQGCSHGGHLKCMKSWYSRNTLCPTGCGHHCEYQ